MKFVQEFRDIVEYVLRDVVRLVAQVFTFLERQAGKERKHEKIKRPEKMKREGGTNFSADLDNPAGLFFL